MPARLKEVSAASTSVLRPLDSTRTLEALRREDSDQMTHDGKAGEALRKVDNPDTCGSGISWGSLFSSVWGNAIEKGRRWLKGANQKT